MLHNKFKRTWNADAYYSRLEILSLLRKENKEIQLECAIPFPGQADSWEKADQKRRYNILTAADKAVITSEQYNRGCFFTCNRYMVDKADVVVCAFNGKSGGTAYTVDYALKQNKIVIQIDPETSEVSMLSKRSFESVWLFFFCYNLLLNCIVHLVGAWWTHP